MSDNNKCTQVDAILELASVLASRLESPNEMDSNYETANVVDGLFAISRSIGAVAKALNRIADAQEKAGK